MHLPRQIYSERLLFFLIKIRQCSYYAKKDTQFISIPADYRVVNPDSSDITLDTENVSTERYNPFERLLLEQTPLIFLLKQSFRDYDNHRNRILSNLKNLGVAAKIPGPKFVFAHVLAPHPPFVLGEKGESVYPEHDIYSIGDATDYMHTRTRESYRLGYAKQIQGLNGAVLQALDSIAKNSTRPYVIFLLGDHGARSETDWKSLKNTNVHEGFSNLQAVGMSEKEGARELGLSQSSTPINTLRRILDKKMEIELPSLEDKSFYSTLAYPYDFTRVYPRRQRRATLTATTRDFNGGDARL